MIKLSHVQLAEYVRAVYEVEVDGRWIAASTLALTEDAPAAALISACNPYSEILPDIENSERHRQLQQSIVNHGCRWWPARGRSADGSWVEPGFLVLAPLDRIDAWARAFAQHAVWLPPHAGTQASLRVYSGFAGEHPPAQSGGLGIVWVPAPE